MTTAPCEVWFYHLEQTALDQALPDLLEKTLAKGWKAVVRTTASERLEHLDGWLWSYRDDSFLPHGVDTEPLAERQPILLTAGMELPNSAQAVFPHSVPTGLPGTIVVSPEGKVLRTLQGPQTESTLLQAQTSQ